MKRIIPLLLTLVLAATSMAQDISPWSMELGVRPHFTQLKKSDAYDIEKNSDFDVYLTTGYQLNEQTELFVQLGYRQFSFSAVDYAPAFGCDHDGMGGYNQRNSYTQVDVSHNYLSVALGARFKIGKQYFIQPRLDIYSEISNNTSFGLYECGLLTSSPTLTGDEYKFGGGPLALAFALGRDFQISERWSLAVSADYLRFLNKYNMFTGNVPVHQFGLNVGGRHRF